MLTSVLIARAITLVSANLANPSCTIFDCGFDAKDFALSRRVVSLQADSQNDALNIDFYWTIVSNDTLTMGIDVIGARSGWLGFGISANGGMMGADIIVLRKDSGGDNFILEDRFAEDWATPLLDEHQDVLLLSAVRNEDKARTSFSFERKLKPCDGGASEEARDWLKNMDIDIHPTRPSDIIWALGYDDNFYQHGGGLRSRGRIPAFSWKGNIKSDIYSQEPQDLLNATITPKEGTTIVKMVNDPHNGVPKDGTALLHTYWDIPKDGNSYVLTGFQPTYGRGIEPFIHHTLLYGCSEPQSANHTPGPRKESFCSEILFVVDAGKDADKKFGVQIGQGTNIQSFRVEVHYDVAIGNVAHSAHDPGTGYYVHLALDDGTYTPIGTITTGTLALAIPGQSSRTSPDSHFWGECVVGQEAGPEGINILFNIFHQHLVGRTMWATVERKGNYGKMIEMARRNYYDWNFQGASFIRNGTMKVYPGDIIRTHCIYDTTDRWNFNKHGGKAVSKDFITEYGEGTYKEMCFNFMLYYPRKDNFNYCMGRNGGGPSVAQSRRLESSGFKRSTSHVDDYKRTAISVGDALAHSAREHVHRQLLDIPVSIVASIDIKSIAAAEKSAGTRRALDESLWSIVNTTSDLCEMCSKVSFCFGSAVCNKDTGKFNPAFPMCSRAAVCATCYPNSPCSNGEPDPAGVAIKGSGCGTRAYEQCKSAGLCYSAGCDADSDPENNPNYPFRLSQCKIAAACGKCFPNSKCATKNDRNFTKYTYITPLRPPCGCADKNVSFLAIEKTGKVYRSKGGSAASKRRCEMDSTTARSNKQPTEKSKKQDVEKNMIGAAMSSAPSLLVCGIVIIIAFSVVNADAM